MKIQTIRQEFFLNLFEQVGPLKVIYWSLLKPQYFAILGMMFIYGWYGLHLEDVA